MRGTYPQRALQGIVDQFPGIDTIRSSHLFTSGFENSNVLIGTEAGKYVLKIFEGDDISRENILFELSVMEKLAKAGRKTPVLLPGANGQLSVNAGGKIAILMQCIEGENMEKHVIGDHLTEEIGEETGKMDTALADIADGSKTRQNYAFDLKHFLLLEPKVAQLSPSFDRTLFADIFAAFRKIKLAFDALPSGIIHNDIVLHNILAQDDRLTGIVDFSDIAYSPYIQNIAVAFAQCFFTYNWQPRQAKIFLDAYRKYHPLADEELTLLYPLTLARFAVLILEFHHWNCTGGEDPQRTAFIRDNFGFLRRFLQMGEAEFLRIIGKK